ncbi:hypothetical protein GIB67_026495 [Kingdonia uniflora]|uniref:Uncharacterized protein n=1 Tax=Kingdonia uniflora TaxID=39325 RepID=A0A7J7P6D5_9MAGN|nr:hypothetical protein GIB67_026495 [Kingdonia uniflora]
MALSDSSSIDYYEKKKLACILSFMNHLIKFKEQKSMDKSAPAKHHKIPSILAKRFRTVFVEDSQKIELSGEKRNLLISYVLVLTLLADNFSTDITDIARDLKMSNVSLRDHYKNLGCKLSREGKLMLVTLPVPLQFPKPKMSRRRE